MRQPRDLIGHLLNDTYRIERLIGEGGMGVVYEASHLPTSRRFAVKLLAPRWSFLSDEEAVARFRREVEVTREVGHPHIVELIDADQTDDGLLYFVMELLEGEDLAELLGRRGRLRVSLAAVILEQVAAALEAAHRHDVVHRDLKPSNIFLCRREASERPHVKVMDFSLSKVLGASRGPTDESIVLGTPWYLAPEQAQGRSAAVTPRTDVYAAGAILYRMVTGEPPFKTPVLDDLLDAIATSEPRAPRELAPELSAEAEAAILRALSKRPDDRHSSMRELAESFAAAVEDPFAQGPTARWRASGPTADSRVRPLAPDELKLNTPPPALEEAAEPGEDDHRTPPVERIDDLKTPPLERVAAGELEQAGGRELREDSLPSVIAPEVEDAPTIPAMDPVVRHELPSMRPEDLRGGKGRSPAARRSGAKDGTARAGKLPEIHTGKTEPDPLAAGGEGTDPDGPTAPNERGARRTRRPARPRKDVPTVIVEPAASTPAGRPPRRGRALVAVALLLAAAAVGIGLWLHRSPSPAAALDARAGDRDAAPRESQEWRRVWLDSKPSGASVYAEGTLLGKTPLSGARISTGRVQLLLARRGFEDRLVDLEPGATDVRAGVVALARHRLPATLRIITRSGGRALEADLFLDGERIGRSPLSRRVRPGRHRIEARRPGYRSAALRLKVLAGRRQRVVLVLKRR